MAKNKSNEWEFQGEVLKWLQEDISKRPAMGLDKATQEPSKVTPKRSDLVVWQDRYAEVAFMTWELKTPETPINNPVLLADACEKAQRWNAPFFAIWNMQAAELYKTPSARPANPSDRLAPFTLNKEISNVDDWLDKKKAKSLKRDGLRIFEEAWQRYSLGDSTTIEIDASVFVEKLGVRLYQLRQIFVAALQSKAEKNPKLRKRLKEMAAEQGFISFVDDVPAAIASQYAYRLVGQILFYFALSRKQKLPTLDIDPEIPLPQAFRPFWDEVRRYDYEALFSAHELDEIVPFSASTSTIIRHLVAELKVYDWNKLRDDVLGSVFEHLIPRQEQHLLGQFYTPASVADLLVAFTVSGENAHVLDPGCGSGTFLMSAYEYLKATTGENHSQLLSRIWGFDLSAFAAELAAINLFRQDMSAFDNFPRIVSGNYFDREVGEEIPFPPAKVGGQGKVVIEIPEFTGIVANPPYLRSQNQDDLNSQYKGQLYNIAAKNGIAAASKTDLFAFFIYKSLEFLAKGSRLGFVVSSSWLTADYGATLQRALIEKFKLVAVVGSSAESFFSQVDVNTVLIIAEKREKSTTKPEGEHLKFVTLKKSLIDLFGTSTSDYWKNVCDLVDEIELANATIENDEFRAVCVSSSDELGALDAAPKQSRNWSIFMRAPMLYFEVFGGAQ